MLTVYGVETQQQDVKLPETISVLDHDSTIWFVNSREDADAIEAIAAAYNVVCDLGKWLFLNEPGWHPNPQLFSDYGIVTQSGNHFLDSQHATVVSFSSLTQDAELAAALEQASEHALAELTTEDGRKLVAVDRHHVELMEGIARAYHCYVEDIL